MPLNEESAYHRQDFEKKIWNKSFIFLIYALFYMTRYGWGSDCVRNMDEVFSVDNWKGNVSKSAAPRLNKKEIRQLYGGFLFILSLGCTSAWTSANRCGRWSIFVLLFYSYFYSRINSNESGYVNITTSFSFCFNHTFFRHGCNFFIRCGVGKWFHVRYELFVFLHISLLDLQCFCSTFFQCNFWNTGFQFLNVGILSTL